MLEGEKGENKTGAKLSLYTVRLFWWEHVSLPRPLSDEALIQEETSAKMVVMEHLKVLWSL